MLQSINSGRFHSHHTASAFKASAYDCLQCQQWVPKRAVTVQAIEHFSISEAWVTKELYFTYHLKLRKAVFGVEAAEISQQENIEVAEVNQM